MKTMTIRLPVVKSLTLAIAACLISACGKKAPPFLPKGEMPLVVDQLNAEWRDGVFYLQGEIKGPREQTDDSWGVTGCRIIYACYPADNTPCEDCPIDYKELKEIQARVMNQGRFACEFPEEKANGIYFFKVGLIGQNGSAGPYSERAKTVVAP